MLSSVTSSVWWKVFLGAIQLDFSDCRRGRVWKSQTQLRFFCNVPTTVVTVCIVIEATMIQRFSDVGSLSESLTNNWMLGRLDIQMGRYDEINLHCMIDRTLADLKVNFFIHVNTSSNRVFFAFIWTLASVWQQNNELKAERRKEWLDQLWKSGGFICENWKRLQTGLLRNSNNNMACLE